MLHRELADDIPGLVVRRGMGKAPPKKRSLHRFIGFGGQIVHGVFNNNIDCLERAVVERLVYTVTDGEYCRPLEPSRGFWSEMSGWQEELLRYMPVLGPLSAAQFCARYSGSKRRMYENAAASLEHRPLQLEDSFIGPFVKGESTHPDKLLKAPRLVSPRKPRFNITLGMQIAHLEKHLYHSISSVFQQYVPSLGRNSHVVFTHLNADQRGREIAAMLSTFRDGVALCSDVKRYDQHYSLDALRNEHRFWLSVVPWHEREGLRKVLKMQEINNFKARCPDGNLKYRVVGRRMSGDMNTSSGNKFTLCGLIWKLLSTLKFRVFLVNDGDDCVFMCERKYVTRLQAEVGRFMARAGFAFEFDAPVDTVERIVFCKSQPVLGPEGYRMVRDPREALARDLTSYSDISNEKVRIRWMNGVGKGGLALTWGMPVWPSFYSMFPTTGDKVSGRQELEALLTSGMWRLSRGMKYAAHDPTPAQRLSFYLAFQILPHEQLALESRFRSMTLRDVPTDFDSVDPLIEPILPGLI